MGSDGCQCEALEANQEARRLQWKEFCTRFYYDQDEKAKRILDYFEASKVDEVSISTPDGDQHDAQFLQLVQFLGLQKCMLPGHQEKFYQKNIQMLEVVKNQVRAGYHTQVANVKYAEFDERANGSQGTNYELWADESGRQKLAVRVQHDYLRTTEKQLQMMQRMEVFIEKHFSNVGSHPFLAGLRAALQWNLESSTVVAWRLSDAVLVESGGSEFTHNALALLVLALNFNHCESVDTTPGGAAANVPQVKFREWHLDPYLSDNDIRQLMRIFPPPRKLEGRATGEKRSTSMDRVNIHGQLDESPKFLDRWCVLL